MDFIFLLTDPLYSFEVASGDSGLPLWGNMHNECVHIQLPPFLAYCRILAPDPHPDHTSVNLE